MSMKDFVLMEKLGQGSYATVYKARRLNDQKLYALKQIKLNKLDDKSKNNALNQVRFLASFSSPSIITYHEAFMEESQGLLCMVMEYADGGDLMKKIELKKKNKEYFSEIQIWKVLISLLHGICYLHQRSILHRDIKPENIFINKEVYKLGDLNVSRLKAQDKKLTQTGTPYYASPQVWNNTPYDEKTDIWSIGCVLYEMAALRPPFAATNFQKLYTQVTKLKQKPIPKQYSNELCGVINRCLTKEPKMRPTGKQILQNWTVKMYENLCGGSNIEEENKKIELLKTISFPKNQQMKNIELPKSNYKEKQIPTFRPATPTIKNKQNYEQTKTTPLKQLTQKWDPQSPVLINNVSKVKEDLKKNEQKKEIHQTPQSKPEGRKRPRSSPRTEMSCEKLKVQGKEETPKSKVQPFTADKMSEIKNRRIFDRKLGKVGKKQCLMEELIKNQQKAYSNLITKSKQLGGIFVTKNELQQRLENVQSVGRF